MIEVLPQILFLVVLVINFLGSLINTDRNSKATFIATAFLLALTYWGGFYDKLLYLLSAKP